MGPTLEPGRRIATSAVIVALVIVAVAGLVGSASGVPTVLSPLPAATTLPMFGFLIAVREAASLRWVVQYAVPTVVGPCLLLAWNPSLLKAAAKVPRRSIVGLAVLSGLTVAAFAYGWAFGVKYQGHRYTFVLCVLNAAALMIAWSLLWLARRRDHFVTTLAAHAFVVAWLVWIAFPWLGELP